MTVTAAMVKSLREETGAGMMECKNALVETKGDVDGARAWLRKKGLATAAKRAGRAAQEGQVAAYIHPGGRVGVLVEVNSETDFVAKNEDFQTLVKDIAMHIAAASPAAALYISKEDVPADVLEKEKEIYREQAKQAGKPDKVLDKIAEGKLKDFYATFCLLEQPFVKEPKQTIGELVQAKIAVIKENIVVRRFTRFKLGEATPGDSDE